MDRELDIQEKLITRELIRNPRFSDNQIAKRTDLPTMSVNRKRKKLEEEGLIQYYTALNRSESGLGLFYMQQMYIIKLRAGITKTEYFEKIETDSKLRIFNTKFISSSYLGERDGHLAIIFVLHAKDRVALNDEFNGKIVPYITSAFGHNAIIKIDAIPITNQIRSHHNYLLDQNMGHGTIKEDWPDEYIFVDNADNEQNAKLHKFVK